MTTISPSRIASVTRSCRASADASSQNRGIGFCDLEKKRPLPFSTYSVARKPSSFNSYSHCRPEGTVFVSFGRSGSIRGSIAAAELHTEGMARDVPDWTCVGWRMADGGWRMADGDAIIVARRYECSNVR